jgi:hypothetical protein
MIGETERFIACGILRRMKRANLLTDVHLSSQKREEFTMRFASGAIAAALFAAAALPAGAAASMYTTAEAATTACGADEVVWVDLDRGRFYHKNQDKFAKGNNGGYACLKAAHAQYREGRE